ncbi:MAG TPA: hypothetical protein VMD25_04240 [Acidobacteriaceae bacterium]|nr:hypothetical protein [Acidobacteriaceae bacterium]
MLIEMLRRTLERVESSPELDPEERALVDLKRVIVLTIAEHEERVCKPKAA